jgi:hypothetical protein
LEYEVEHLIATHEVDGLAIARCVLGDVVDRQPVWIVSSFALTDRFVLADRAGLLDSANDGDMLSQLNFLYGVRAISDLDAESPAISIRREERDRPLFDGFAVVGDHPMERCLGLATCAGDESEHNQRDCGASMIQRSPRNCLAAMFKT